MASLSEFYRDAEGRKNVKAYLDEFIEKEAVKMLFERENVDAIPDAKELIDKAFSNLDVMFAPKQNKIPNNPR